jgi:hypothetical protein
MSLIRGLAPSAEFAGFMVTARLMVAGFWVGSSAILLCRHRFTGPNGFVLFVCDEKL